MKHASPGTFSVPDISMSNSALVQFEKVLKLKSSKFLPEVTEKMNRHAMVRPRCRFITGFKDILNWLDHILSTQVESGLNTDSQHGGFHTLQQQLSRNSSSSTRGPSWFGVSAHAEKVPPTTTLSTPRLFFFFP